MTKQHLTKKLCLCTQEHKGKITNANCASQGVFTWRRASPTKRAGFHLAFTWEKLALLPGLARLAESLGLTTFIFPRNLESDICVQVFILYATHKQTACEMKSYLKNTGQDNLCRVYGALTCQPSQEGQPSQVRLYGKFQALLETPTSSNKHPLNGSRWVHSCSEIDECDHGQ